MSRMQNANPLDWLLEKDKLNSSVRYFALQDLLELPKSDVDVRTARSSIMRRGPVPVILEAQEPFGAWRNAFGRRTSIGSHQCLLRVEPGGILPVRYT